ncbi:MAG: hypothetical protein ACKOEZ_14550 [Spartobacteria bacterium]
MIIAAAQAGKHIICEKPLSVAFGEGKSTDTPGLLPKRNSSRRRLPTPGPA